MRRDSGIAFGLWRAASHTLRHGENLPVCASFATFSLVGIARYGTGLRSMDSLEGENSKRLKEGEPIEYPRFLTLDSFSLARAYEIEFYCFPGAIEEARTPYFITHRSKVDKVMVFVLTT